MTRQDALESDGATGQPWRWLRTLSLWIVLSCFTALVFAISLAATMPASALRNFIDLPPQITDLQGTIWHGTARLQDGYALRWDGQFGALILARLSANVTLTGADTQLMGVVQISPWMLALCDVTGWAGPGLLALAPGLPFDGCTSRAIVDVPLVSFGRGQAAAEGRIDIAAGDCTDFNGDSIQVPAMTLTLHSEGKDAVADLADTGSALAQLIVAGDRRLLIRVEPAGAALIPGMPTSGPTMIEYPF
jgi:hypothetical protein